MGGGILVLDRPVMTAREGARQLRIPPSTLLWWLEGGHRSGRDYDSILRAQPTGSQEITWGEVVEARYLRAYRAKGISLQRLRPFVAALRDEFGVPYPLAHFRPWVDTNRRLLLEIQRQTDVPTDLAMIFEHSNGQTILNPLLEENFLSRVEFSDDDDRAATRICPMGKNSPVVLDPLVSSAAATVRGIRTEILAEQVNAGTTVDDVADEFDLPVEVVRAALAYEWDSAA